MTRTVPTSTTVTVLLPTKQVNNSNDRKGWRRGATNRRIMRNNAGWVAKQQAHPIATPARLTLRFAFSDARRRDLDNVEVKGFIDGLVDAGIVPDDNHRHITSVTRELDPERVAKGYIRITAILTTNTEHGRAVK